MVSCWDADPSLRPTMAKVKEKMFKLMSLFTKTGTDLTPVLPLERGKFFFGELICGLNCDHG